MEHALIIDAVRSPRGRGNAKGALAEVRPVELLAGQLRALSKRQEFDTGALADVVIGCVTQTGDQGTGIARPALLAAGYGDGAPGLTVNRYCASGISAVRLAALAALENGGLAVGGGVESMSRVPMAADKGPLTHDIELQRALSLIPIGIAADAVATMEGFGRAECDDYAARSQARAVAAREEGHFSSIVPVEGVLDADETPRPGTTAEKLSSMAPAFAEMGEKYGIDAALCRRYGLDSVDHVHHAGNSPAMADGASAVLVAAPDAARRLGLKPRARILAVAEVAIDRTLALTGAVDATKKALERAGLTTADIDLFEINESFAALMLHYLRHMGIGADRLNVDGGAIALGHAMGSTGSALIGTALDALERRGERRAVIAACGAAGLASAMIVERV